MKFYERLSKYYKEYGLEEDFTQPTIGASQPSAPDTSTATPGTSAMPSDLAAMIQKHPEYGPAQAAVNAALAKRDQVVGKIQNDLNTHIQALSAAGHPAFAPKTVAPQPMVPSAAPQL